VGVSQAVEVGGLGLMVIGGTEMDPPITSSIRFFGFIQGQKASFMPHGEVTLCQTAFLCRAATYVYEEQGEFRLGATKAHSTWLSVRGRIKSKILLLIWEKPLWDNAKSA
jgi:hypothetical protein